jgi:endoglucanase
MWNIGTGYNVPIWLGESGENTDQWIQQFVSVLEKNDIGWCFWPYKKMQKTSCMVSMQPPMY